MDNVVEVELFIPGRLCVMGEHTDWMARYSTATSTATATGNIRSEESGLLSSIRGGATLVCSTNEGIYARATKVVTVANSKNIKGNTNNNNDNNHNYNEKKNKTRQQHDNNDNNSGGSCCCFSYTSSEGKVFEQDQYDIEKLTNIAREGGYFSYIAGSLIVMIQRHGIDKHRSRHTVRIHNYKTTLPMKKGLSSSAAICVLVVQAYNRLFELNLLLKEVMECAYLGERLTPSNCGRMDQCVAMGQDCIGVMHFIGEDFHLEILPCRAALHFVVADLQGSKNTVKILADLNACFTATTALTDEAKKCQEFPRLTGELLDRASVAIQSGDVALLGALMKEAQAIFDCYVAPACASELTAPLLHRVMGHPQLAHVSGIKGIGSQGDGAVQLLCRDREQQVAVIEILRAELGLTGFPLTIPASDAPAFGIV